VIKRVTSVNEPVPPTEWLDLIQLADVDVTSEQPTSPITNVRRVSQEAQPMATIDPLDAENKRCATCRWWEQGAGLADVEPKPNGSDGNCTLVVTGLHGRLQAFSHRSDGATLRTHRTFGCVQWERRGLSRRLPERELNDPTLMGFRIVEHPPCSDPACPICARGTISCPARRMTSKAFNGDEPDQPPPPVDLVPHGPAPGIPASRPGRGAGC
jgi:hypothetical protein